MSPLSAIRVDIETQKILSDIRDITLKIKREFIVVNETIRNKGNLCVAVDEANNILTQVAQELGIQSLDEILTPENDDEVNSVNLATVDEISRKLMSVMDA